jgi:hypothetical protein
VNVETGKGKKDTGECLKMPSGLVLVLGFACLFHLSLLGRSQLKITLALGMFNLKIEILKFDQIFC